MLALVIIRQSIEHGSSDLMIPVIRTVTIMVIEIINRWRPIAFPIRRLSSQTPSSSDIQGIVCSLPGLPLG